MISISASVTRGSQLTIYALQSSRTPRPHAARVARGEGGCGAADRRDRTTLLHERTIDIETYDRHRDKLREELTLAQMDRTPPRSSRKWTLRASWRSQSAFYRARRTCGCPGSLSRK